ncbi:MAG TPA: hypothetical protein VF773_08850 [Verrucomicrobiae bacterium]
MNRETQLQVQAYLDNELSAGEARKVSQLISSDTFARDLFNELKGTREVLMENEPAVQVPDSRDFYWSQIQRRIATAEREPAVKHARPWWIRLLAPAAGAVALFAVLLSVMSPSNEKINISGAIAATPHQLEQPSDVSTITFRSESEGVNVVWITSE